MKTYGDHAIVVTAETLEEIDYARQLLDSCVQLGPNARRVLLALAERLVKGKEHGDFDKPHNWDKESAEEALDLAVYQAAKLLSLGGKPSQENMRECTVWPIVDADGRTPDGKPWVPPVGARVRIVARMLGPYHEPFVGSNITVIEARRYDDDFMMVRSEENAANKGVRVVPA